jgi:hypothetical protein
MGIPTPEAHQEIDSLKKAEELQVIAKKKKTEKSFNQKKKSNSVRKDLVTSNLFIEARTWLAYHSLMRRPRVVILWP